MNYLVCKVREQIGDLSAVADYLKVLIDDNNVVHWNSKLYPDVRTFHHILYGYYENTDEYQSFPRPPGLT